MHSDPFDPGRFGPDPPPRKWPHCRRCVEPLILGNTGKRRQRARFDGQASVSEAGGVNHAAHEATQDTLPDVSTLPLHDSGRWKRVGALCISVVALLVIGAGIRVWGDGRPSGWSLPASARDEFTLRAHSTRVISGLTSLNERKALLEGVRRSPARRCWDLSGSRGQLGFSLPELIYPTSISLHYAPETRSPKQRQPLTPIRLVLWGAIDGQANYDRFIKSSLARRTGRVGGGPPIANKLKFVALAELTYDPAKNGVHQVHLLPDEVGHSGVEFGVFVVEIADGGESCLQEVVVHGRRV